MTNRDDETTAEPLPDPRSRNQSLCALLNQKFEALGRSVRSLEREMGWSHGSLGRLLAGKSAITLRDIEELAPALGTTPLELLSEVFAGPAQAQAVLEPGWIDVLTCQATVLEEASEVLQELQGLIPRPTLTEVAEMRTGARPVTRYAFLIGQLQSYLCSLENVASDLKVDLEYSFDPQGAEHLENFFNALTTAVERLTPQPAAPEV